MPNHKSKKNCNKKAQKSNKASNGKKHHGRKESHYTTEYNCSDDEEPKNGLFFHHFEKKAREAEAAKGFRISETSYISYYTLDDSGTKQQVPYRLLTATEQMRFSPNYWDSWEQRQKRQELANKLLGFPSPVSALPHSTFPFIFPEYGNYYGSSAEELHFVNRVKETDNHSLTEDSASTLPEKRENDLCNSSAKEALIISGTGPAREVDESPPSVKEVHPCIKEDGRILVSRMEMNTLLLMAADSEMSQGQKNHFEQLVAKDKIELIEDSDEAPPGFEPSERWKLNKGLWEVNKEHRLAVWKAKKAHYEIEQALLRNLPANDIPHVIEKPIQNSADSDSSSIADSTTTAQTSFAFVFKDSLKKENDGNFSPQGVVEVAPINQEEVLSPALSLNCTKEAHDRDKTPPKNCEEKSYGINVHDNKNEERNSANSAKKDETAETAAATEDSAKMLRHGDSVRATRGHRRRRGCH